MQLAEIIGTQENVSLENLENNSELAKEVQKQLIDLGLLDPPADGKFGRFSTQALQDFQSLMKIEEAVLGKATIQALMEVKEVIPLQLSNNLASRIIKYMQSKDYFVARGKQRYNVVYIEGANADGVPNADKFNEWNDRRIVIEIATGIPQIVGNWLATTEPGHHYTVVKPMNPQGAARIAFGQYQSWQVGTHGNSEPHEALVQTRVVKVHRDRNKDGFRTGDPEDIGSHFGINQHWGYDNKFVDKASAGCLVGQTRQGHREFMQIIKQDRRYQLNNKYTFMSTIIAGDDLAKTVPA
ncbi:peptidoglycan-binding domain-containing protein [Nostoc parmelioides]|uniref:Peptidoglycan-binding protein n=1 Tax=Nostoc parmelioides FACHB-3921 TaxID=2692909 RepID=A0ABR8BAZ1_9NOSO|nr:peptidoglycan-binding domain-containing protein [Nostoc parmelioides]MBD2250649.1 peptidoglycan-binding protein [Nostoc parmelioides FACHB-3921]